MNKGLIYFAATFTLINSIALIFILKKAKELNDQKDTFIADFEKATGIKVDDVIKGVKTIKDIVDALHHYGINI